MSVQIKNTKNSYGVVSITLHWLTAIAVFFMFGLGLWMHDLDYYHPWYRSAPDLHRSIGVLLVSLVVIRLCWKLANPKPQALPEHKAWEKVSAKITHWVLYLLIICMLPTGYFITTAKGQGLDVFNWFTIPATITSIDNLEDIAGEIHEMLAFSIIGLALFHIAGALKHHFIDRDQTLRRMLRAKSQ